MKILVLFPYQWGYNTDFFFFSTILKEKFDVTYIGYDLNLSVMPSEGVKVINVPYKGKLSILQFYRTIYKEIQTQNYTHVFLNYFLSCSMLLLLLPRNIKKVADIRTSFIFRNKIKTRVFNLMLRAELIFFKNITVVSAGVAEFLKLSNKIHVLPLGGPNFPRIKKTFHELNFLYVGTFYDRDIVQTIKAFRQFVNSHAHKIAMKYTIIGYGSDQEVELIKQAVVSFSLENCVTFLGTVRYPELSQFFLNHNIGICYIPLTKYYDCQPPTKTFEYLLSGNVVLGTKTSENLKVLNATNGVLVTDTVEDFYNGMVMLYERRLEFNSTSIQEHATPYSWANIVNCNLIPFLNSLR
jgi:hypothetical protein